MKSREQLRKPENWQDFETLCKKLWGEIWECSEIKKNGRAGQKQNGVDVYGVPKGESQYYGIQCKGKDEYTHKQLTEQEVDEEIEEAKKFQPPLRKFYFATTAVKDSKIEEYVRKKDIEIRQKGLFEVHLFSWEDIVELIDENRQTHDWYVRNQDFKTNRKLRVTFENSSNEIEILVPFLKKVIQYQKRPTRHSDSVLTGLLDAAMRPNFNLNTHGLLSPDFNESVCRFRIYFHNVGSSVIENLKVFLYFAGEFVSVQTCKKGGRFSIDVSPYNIFIDSEKRQGVVEPLPSQLPLVQKDSFSSDTLCLRPIFHTNSEVVIHWRLISENYNDEGKLVLKIIPEFREETETIFIDDSLEERTEERVEDLVTRN